MKKINIFTKYRLPKLLLLLFIVIAPAFSANANQEALSKEDISSLLNQTFDVMESHYIAPDIVPGLREIFKSRFNLGLYHDLRQLDDFAETIGRDLRAVSGDKHLSLFTIKTNDQITHVLSHPSGKLTYNYGFEEVRYLAGNIGYLKFNKFHPDEKARGVVDAAFNFLKQSDGLILDMRDTLGGSPQLAQYMLSYFFPENTPLWEVKNKNGQVLESIVAKDKVIHDTFHSDTPVWILTSRNTASASELFAGIMQATSKATIVGDITAGAGFYVGVRQITDELVFRISLSKPVISANQKNWEKLGIIPDIQVPSLDAMDQVMISRKEKQ